MIERWCDNHGGSEEHPAEERTYALNDRPRLADTCNPCDENMSMAQMRAFLAEFGRPVPSEAKAGRVKPNSAQHNAMVAAATGSRKGRKPTEGAHRRHQCLWCVLDYAASSAFTKHLKDLHGFDSSADAFGRVCPVCAQTDIEMMGGHASRSHADIASTASELFVWARENGDPYGIYAERLAQGTNVQLAA
ncbi:hypothetical protein AB0P21_09840 [Kribbella sp. NPDC056861]|uniref:hypothetical protein n=1 Tax=Kribbella sp. NPDC056861 TaxID=3154857 RepID=UPI0034390F65